MEKLPKYNSSEIVPEVILNSDAILYFLKLPLSANDFLWLEKLPKSMPIWLVASYIKGLDSNNEIEELKSQISGDQLHPHIDLISLIIKEFKTVIDKTSIDGIGDKKTEVATII